MTRFQAILSFLIFIVSICIMILLLKIIHYTFILPLQNSEKDIMYKFYSSQLKSNDSITISECIKFVDNKCVISAETIINNTDDLKILIYGK